MRFRFVSLLAALSLSITSLTIAQTDDSEDAFDDLLKSVQAARGIGSTEVKPGTGGSGGGVTTPPDDDDDELTAAALFAAEINPVVTRSCYTACHQQGGSAGNTRLVYAGVDAGSADANFEVMDAFLSGGGGSLLLSRISGVGHPGGQGIPAISSDEFDDFEDLTEFY